MLIFSFHLFIFLTVTRNKQSKSKNKQEKQSALLIQQFTSSNIFLEKRGKAQQMKSSNLYKKLDLD